MSFAVKDFFYCILLLHLSFVKRLAPDLADLKNESDRGRYGAQLTNYALHGYTQRAGAHKVFLSKSAIVLQVVHAGSLKTV